MNVIPYFFPLLFMLVVAVSGHEQSYYLVAFLYLCTIGVYYLFRRFCLYCTEYLGAYIREISHYNAWTERVIRYEQVKTGTDRRGNARYKTVKRTEYVNHPDRYVADLNIGKTMNISRSSYYNIKNLWDTVNYNMSISGDNIVGGIRHYQVSKFYDVTKKYMSSINDDMLDLTFVHPELAYKTVTVTTTGKYKNKVRHSSSLFNFETITDKDAEMLGLYKYPDIEGFDQPCILGMDVSTRVKDLYQLFNACYGKKYQIRLYLIIYDASKGIGIAEKQRAYWAGGNKNEFVVCLGVNGMTVEWCHCFCWMDEPVLSAKVENYFMINKKLDLYGFNAWLRQNLKLWKRKEFKDFDYINVRFDETRYYLYLASCAAINAIALWLFLR